MEKYRGALINKEAIPNNVRILKNEELYSEIAKASLVITAPTSVLVPIFFFKKPVYSYYPPILGKLSKGLLNFYFKFKIPHVKTMTSTINIEKLLYKNDISIEKLLFSESHSRYLLVIDKKNIGQVKQFLLKKKTSFAILGKFSGDQIQFKHKSKYLVKFTVDIAQKKYFNTLEELLKNG
jgi:hypothetical protein